MIRSFSERLATLQDEKTKLGTEKLIVSCFETVINLLQSISPVFDVEKTEEDTKTDQLTLEQLNKRCDDLHRELQELRQNSIGLIYSIINYHTATAHTEISPIFPNEIPQSKKEKP
jgi:hypothetical protein